MAWIVNYICIHYKPTCPSHTSFFWCLWLKKAAHTIFSERLPLGMKPNRAAVRKVSFSLHSYICFLPYLEILKTLFQAIIKLTRPRTTFWTIDSKDLKGEKASKHPFRVHSESPLCEPGLLLGVTLRCAAQQGSEHLCRTIQRTEGT